MKCFNHNTDLIPTKTQWGRLWLCPEFECDVKCWDGPTSHPGTQEDFDERKATHAIFDKAWKNGTFKSRGKAYKWLSEFLKVPQKDAHIGMLRADKCREVCAALKNFNKD